MSTFNTFLQYKIFSIRYDMYLVSYNTDNYEKKKSYLSKIGFRKDSLLSNVSEKKTS